MISPAQCRAARGWLKMDQKKLAALAGCNKDTLRRFENERNELRSTTEAQVRGVLESKGIVFIFGRNGEPLGIEQKSLISV